MKLKFCHTWLAILTVPNILSLLRARRNRTRDLLIRVASVWCIVRHTHNLDTGGKKQRHRDEGAPLGGGLRKIHVRDRARSATNGRKLLNYGLDRKSVG